MWGWWGIRPKGPGTPAGDQGLPLEAPWPCPGPSAPCSPAPHLRSGGHIHIALMGVDAVKQSLGRHPLHRQPALRGKPRAAGWLPGALLPGCATPHPALSRAHIGGLLVVVKVVHVPGQAKVRDLHHVVLRHQHVAGRQVPVDALRAGGQDGGRPVSHAPWGPLQALPWPAGDHCPHPRSPSARPGTPCPAPPGRHRTPGP